MDAHEDLVEAVARTIWDTKHPFAPWEDDLSTGIGPSLRERQASFAQARAIVALLAEKLSVVTPEMREAGQRANAMVKDNSLGLAYVSPGAAYDAMHRASALYPKDKASG